MHSIVRATLIALIPTVGVGAVGRAQGPMKIAYVNTAALMEAAPGRDSATAILTREGNAFEAQLAKLRDSVNARLTKFQKDEPTMTPAVEGQGDEGAPGARAGSPDQEHGSFSSSTTSASRKCWRRSPTW